MIFFPEILKTNFICCSSKKDFGQNPEILDLHFFADMKLYTQPATLAKCIKINDF